ncbi:MAG: hypothetical protein OXK76_04165 [Gammaproteobacteria bacterium]|nr:hypothetical protein [Gammaproteobacteria bacterium]
METGKGVDFRDIVCKGGKARLRFALDFVDVIGELRAHKLGEVHVETIGFSVT